MNSPARNFFMREAAKVEKCEEFFTAGQTLLSSTCLGVRSQHVHDAVVRIQHTELQDDEGLLNDVDPPEARDSLVPDTAQHLLDVGMSHEGFLFTFDCQLESLQGLVMTGGPDCLLVIIVQHHFQLVRATRVIQKRGGETLNLLPQHRVFFTELRLHFRKVFQLIRQFKCSQDRIFACQGNQRWTCEGLVCIQSGHGEPQTVSLTVRPTLLTVTLDVVWLRQGGSSVYQYLQYFVIVFLSRQLERSDVRGVGGSHGVLYLPGVGSSSLTRTINHQIKQQQILTFHTRPSCSSSSSTPSTYSSSMASRRESQVCVSNVTQLTVGQFLQPTFIPLSSRISMSSGFSLIIAIERAVLPRGSVQLMSKAS